MRGYAKRAAAHIRNLPDVIAGLPVGSAVFICYAIWYLVMMAHYGSISLRFWGSAIGMGLIVGAGFILSGVLPPQADYTALRRVDPRVFLIPFCVSSFSSMALSNDFVLIFAPHSSATGVAAGSCVIFLLLWSALRVRYRCRIS